MKKDAVLTQLRAEKVIGLARAETAATLTGCARALAAGGLHFLEIPTTTPAVMTALQTAAAALPDFRFGLGTVLDVDTARAGILAGASFIVTPSPRPDVVTLARRYGIAVFSGAFTRADILAAHASGADGVKIFPGELFGPAYLRSLREATPHIPMLPIGGVTEGTVAEFLRAGALAAFAGSSLLAEEDVLSGDWPRITAQAQAFVAAVSEAHASVGA